MKIAFYKKALFTILISFISLCAKAQIGYDYAQYDFGVSGALNTVFGDAETTKATPSLNIHFTYNQTPFVNYVLEGDFGRMQGGSVDTRSGRYFASDFSAFHFRAQLQAGELIDYSRSAFANAFKNLYIGAGIGIIYDNLTAVNRQSYQVANFYSSGPNSASELYLPVRIGYEFKFFNSVNEPSFKVDVAYQYNHIFGDDLDGFDTGSKGDLFTQFSIGVKFAIGGVTSYRKQIYY